MIRTIHGVNFLLAGELISKVTSLPFVTIKDMDGEVGRVQVRQIPHYMLRVTSKKTAQRCVFPLRFDNVTWNAKQHDEKVVLDLIAGWLKDFMAILNDNADQQFELMPAMTRHGFGTQEKKENVKEEDFLLEEAKKMFQCIAAYAPKSGHLSMGLLGPRLSVSAHSLDGDTSTFSMDGSWNQTSWFNIQAVTDKAVEELRRELTESTNPYHGNFLNAATVINGRTCLFQCRDDVLGDLLPQMVDRQSVEDEVNKLFVTWARRSILGHLHDGLLREQFSVKLDWIERKQAQ